jgi:branched-chain amino acid transport system permease protein
MSFVRTWSLRLAVLVGLLALLFFLNGYLEALAKHGPVLNPYYFRVGIMLPGIAIILAVSLNLVNGVTGQFSIGHAGFMAIGAYVGAAFTVYGQHRFLPPLEDAGVPVRYGVTLLALLLGGGAAGIAGFLVGLPSLRLRGDYLAIVTLGFGEIIRVAITNIEVVGGSAGFRGYQYAPGQFVRIPQLTDFFWVYLVVVLLLVLSRNLLRSTQGLAFFSVREDEIAAEAMGVNTTRVKVTAFVISAFFAGVAGALFAHYEGYLQPQTFNFLRSIEIVTMVVLGGMGSLSGSVIGAAILTIAPEFLRGVMGDLGRRGVLPPQGSVDIVRQLLYALLLIVLMLTRPEGLFGARELSLRGLFTRRKPQIRSSLT